MTLLVELKIMIGQGKKRNKSKKSKKKDIEAADATSIKGRTVRRGSVRWRWELAAPKLLLK